VGFFRGFLAPFRGGLYVARHRLWPYLLLPLVLDLALGAATMFASARYWREELTSTLTTSPVIGWIFLAVMTVLGGIVLFLVAQPILLAVFTDRLSERVERSVCGTAPAVPFIASTGRALVHGLLKLVLYGIALLVGLGLTAITGVGSLVGVGLGAIFLAYDGFDYPLSRRGATFGKKWAYLARHPAQTLGFGLGATILYLVPLAIFVAPPFVAAGATLVFLEADGGAKLGKGGDQDELAKGQAAKGPGEKVA
jgi:CysZ protein